MKKFSILISLSVLILACQNKDAKVVQDKIEACSSDKSSKGKKFEMYEMSEMAALMEQMYVDNQRLKERIKKGETIGAFPNHFLKIHEAVMTDESDNDAFFKTQAKNFIKAQEQIYKDPKNAKKHFNEGIDACIQCHQVKCGGPIPKIKKLYIKD
jgi:hypothetical protein